MDRVHRPHDRGARSVPGFVVTGLVNLSRTGGRRPRDRARRVSGMLSGMANWGGMLRRAARRGMDLLPRPATRPAATRPAATGTAATGTAATGTGTKTAVRTAPTRDRARTIAYAPRPDGAADPGEIVWAWVPYEENDGRGKDRPLLVVGRSRTHLLALMLSSQHDRADDPNWLSVGTGGWDEQHRESFVRLDRVLEVPEHGIRREGAVLSRDRFDRVATHLRDHYGWS